MPTPDKPPETDRASATKAAILNAAGAEFSDNGLKGARMENVARRAGCNKALVYRYFSDKDTLFRETIKAALAKRTTIFESIPDDLAKAMILWSEATTADPDFMRLIMREALDSPPGGIVEESARSAYYDAQVAVMKEMQGDGALAKEFDATYVFFALMALIAFPSAFPQITKLVTGHEPASSTFKRNWRRMLKVLAGKLGDD